MARPLQKKKGQTGSYHTVIKAVRLGSDYEQSYLNRRILLAMKPDTGSVQFLMGDSGLQIRSKTLHLRPVLSDGNCNKAIEELRLPRLKLKK